MSAISDLEPTNENNATLGSDMSINTALNTQNNATNTKDNAYTFNYQKKSKNNMQGSISNFNGSNLNLPQWQTMSNLGTNNNLSNINDNNGTLSSLQQLNPATCQRRNMAILI